MGYCLSKSKIDQKSISKGLKSWISSLCYALFGKIAAAIPSIFVVFATFFADFFLFVFITFAAVGRVIVSAIEVGPKGGGGYLGVEPKSHSVSLSVSANFLHKMVQEARFLCGEDYWGDLHDSAGGWRERRRLPFTPLPCGDLLVCWGGRNGEVGRPKVPLPPKPMPNGIWIPVPAPSPQVAGLDCLPPPFPPTARRLRQPQSAS